MEVIEVITKKKDLETAIQRLIIAFEKETKCRIESLELEKTYKSDGTGEILIKSAKVKVEL